MTVSNKPSPGTIINPNGETAVIHVSPLGIARNRANNNDEQPVTIVMLQGKTFYCNEISINGPSAVKYANPAKQQEPFFGHVSVVVVTSSPVEVIS